MLVGSKKERLDIKAALSNSFGFGGHNSSIIFAPYKWNIFQTYYLTFIIKKVFVGCKEYISFISFLLYSKTFLSCSCWVTRQCIRLTPSLWFSENGCAVNCLLGWSVMSKHWWDDPLESELPEIVWCFQWDRVESISCWNPLSNHELLE